MNAINAYFDGNTCIPLEKTDFKKNQRLIIVPLDDFICSDDNKEKSGLSFWEKNEQLREKFAFLLNDPEEAKALDDFFDNLRDYNEPLRKNEEDPFIYSEENMKYLRQSIAEAKK